MKRVIYADRTLSNQIIAELKQAGIPKKSYKIKTDINSINITVTDPYVSLEDVGSVVYKYKSIDYDERGEILQGGNTFVFVKYSDNAFDTVIPEYMSDATAAYEYFQGDYPRNTYVIDTANGEVYVIGFDGSRGDVELYVKSDNRGSASSYPIYVTDDAHMKDVAIKAIATWIARFDLHGTFRSRV